MKKQTITLFYLLLFVSINAFSQQALTFSGSAENNFTSGYFTKYVPGDDYKFIEGNPYLFEKWSTGVIKLENGANLKMESCMYDLYKERLMFLQDENPLYFSNPEDIDRFNVGTSEFINLKNENNNDFYEILVEGKDLLLLKKHKCDIIEGKESTGITQATADKFKITKNYYLKKGDVLAKVKVKEKDILNLLIDKKHEVKKYIMDNNLKTKNENDLVEIFKFYSTVM